jgi:hypothetical protein
MPVVRPAPPAALLRTLALASLAVSLFAVGGCGTAADTANPPDCTAMHDTWASFAGSFFSSHCSGCHGFASSQASVEANAAFIESMVSSGTMPPGGGVSASDRQRIVNWLGCGTP